MSSSFVLILKTRICMCWCCLKKRLHTQVATTTEFSSLRHSRLSPPMLWRTETCWLWMEVDGPAKHVYVYCTYTYIYIYIHTYKYIYIYTMALYRSYLNATVGLHSFVYAHDLFVYVPSRTLIYVFFFCCWMHLCFLSTQADGHWHSFVGACTGFSRKCQCWVL